MEKIKQKIFVKYPFLSGSASDVRYVETDSLISIGTNGKDIFYNPKYLKTLTEEEQIFVFAHEICHIAFNHIFKSEDKNPTVWNMATDAVINAYLKKDGLKLVKGAIYVPQAIHYDTDEFYRTLIQQKGGEDVAENQGQYDRLAGQDVGHDTHGLWEEAVINKQKYSEPETISDLDNMQFSQPDIEKPEKLGEDAAFKQNADDRNVLINDLVDLLAEQVIEVGYTTNSDIRKVGCIGSAKPLMDWRMLLKEAITVEVDWSYRNAEIEDRILKSHLETIPQPETEIVLDTSGSIDEELLKNFLRECKNLLRTSKVKVGCFDTEFYGFKEIRTEEDVDKMEFVGGGGTDFNIAVGAFSRRVENKIIFTDGEADMPEKPMDAIWIVCGGKKIHPKGGRVIEIATKQLNR